MDISGFSITATSNALSVALSAIYTECMIVNSDSAFLLTAIPNQAMDSE
jgi:hypothetical protein